MQDRCSLHVYLIRTAFPLLSVVLPLQVAFAATASVSGLHARLLPHGVLPNPHSVVIAVHESQSYLRWTLTADIQA